MSSSETVLPPKRQTFRARLGGFAFVAILVLAGPVLIGIGSSMTDSDEELARTGIHTTGTIVDFNDVRKASNRKITVEYVAADGAGYSTFASVDHDQQPAVGGDVTVIYSDSNPGKAIVEGYDGGGVSVRGIGALFLLIFTVPVGVVLGVKRLRKNRGQRTR
ncbi:conserved hypothetical protein [Pseudarthrobacter chlorophenolicus A6]|uniref:DUF3592 domain-containing protein n=1 Tax=Pseudarthrobacter chlorophenolicus (strain ATCC 700700 / DSM 12829 / CIP 107037 / JCM 12360 / KCTC 9906 / NCIMB 13794 / A6) TaxID=452863 RepID=B8H6Z5_PSECP|nr:DUF3592 domain-containing protein [Pseudarthrobacter chlorophenolicus]ACL39716.1 conserved hypothetical protein [Pseudarthrobacter chlorophenolicus A6]SDQ94904.1 Protein of unknown function [Pseudarthrobacter chlorophenolicus]